MRKLLLLILILQLLMKLPPTTSSSHSEVGDHQIYFPIILEDGKILPPSQVGQTEGQ